MRSNCLWYALDQWVSVGGRLGWVPSTHWFIPHVQHHDRQERLTQFVPLTDLPEPWYSLFGFEGIVEVGDKDAAKRGITTPLGMLVGTLILLVSGGVWLLTRTVQRALA